MKKTLSIILVLCMMISLLFTNSIMAAPAVTFTDVTAGTELGNAIYKLVESGIVVGYPDGTFKADNHLTRAELTKMVNLVFGYTEADTVGFTDVTDADWFKPYVLVAKKAGYIKGFEDGSFRGNSNLTREQACAIIARCAGLKETKMIINISDPVSDWADVDVKKVIAAGFMNLEEGDKFRAKEDITRGELSILLTRYMDAKSTEQTPSGTVPPVIVPPVTGGGAGAGGGGGGGGGGDDTVYHTVTLELNGGTLPAGKSRTIQRANGTKLLSSDIPTPSKSGYTFGGWYTDSAFTTEYASKNVTSNFKLYAKWTENDEGDTPATPTPVTYTVTFDSDGGSDVAAKTVNEGSKVTKPSNPTKEGHTFVNWTKEDGSVFDFNTTITSDITLKATWNVKKYKVTFDFNGGTLNGEERIQVEVNWNETVANPGDPVKEPSGRFEFEFEGYMTSRNGDTEYDFDTPVVSNFTVYAAWKEISSSEDQQELYDNLRGLISAIDSTRPRPTGSYKVILDNLKVAFNGAKTAYENGEVITKEFLKDHYEHEYEMAKLEFNSMTAGEGGEQEEFLNYCFYNYDPYLTFLMTFFEVSF